MAKNKINDLRDHLFSALERLDNDDLSTEELSKEIEKAQAVAQIGSVIIQSAKIEIDYIRATGMLESNSELFKNSNDQKSLT
jgi:N-acyl-D-aspartate/D-glutamate deacylase